MDSRERLRLLEDNIGEYAIVELTASGRIAHWNIGAERLFDWVEREVVGEPFGLIFTEEDRSRSVDTKELQEATSGRAEAEHWYQKKDGTRFWASGVVMSLRDQDGSLVGFVKILRDITDRKEAHDVINASYKQQQQTAEILQRNLLLGSPQISFPGLEVSAQYEPASGDLLVGGDFFDAFTLTDRRIACVVGDVMGKGLSAAAYTAQVKFALRAFLRDGQDPISALERLNRFLYQSERLDNAQNESTPKFVVLCLALFHPKSGETVFIGAGIEPPLILCADGSTRQIEAEGQPLAIFENAGYAATHFQLEHGDVVLLTTDGLTEARRRNADGEFELLGYDGLTQIAQQALSAGTLEQMGRAIVEQARLFAEGGFRDDICLLLARRQ